MNEQGEEPERPARGDSGEGEGRRAAEGEGRRAREPSFRRRLSEQLTGLLDPESALRRGQDLVTGVAQGTKEELMRIFSAEVRTFLERIDAVDLLQQVVSGLVVDVSMKVRFSRDGAGRVQLDVDRLDTDSSRDDKLESRATRADGDMKPARTNSEPSERGESREPRE